MEEKDTITTKAGDSLGFTLSAEELEEISTHLEGCPPCLEFIESLKTTVKMCRELGDGQKPAPLDASTRQKMLDAYEAMQRARQQSGH
jgi:hypothetical protein